MHRIGNTGYHIKPFLILGILIASILSTNILSPKNAIALTTNATLSFSSGSIATGVSGNVDSTGTIYLTTGVAGQTYTFYWASASTGTTVNLGTCGTGAGSTCNLAYTAPHASMGTWIIHATSTIDTSNNILSYTISSKLTTSSPASGIQGTATTVSGTGFPAEAVTAMIGSYSLGTATPTSGAGGSNGDLSVTASTPAMPKATYSIAATSTTAGTITSSLVFSVLPNVTTSTSYGTVGATTTVTATGFAANSTVTVTSDGVNTATNLTASAVGGAVFTGFTPTGTAGGHDINAVDSSANAGTTAQRYVIINPSISLSVASGHVGDSITINGNAFQPSSIVTIRYDGAGPMTATADTTNGAVSLSYTIPASTAGAHTITASDGASHSAPNRTYIVSPLITLSTTSGSVDDTTVVTGTGFAANSSVTTKWDGTTSGPTITSSNVGSFTKLNFFFPHSVAGTHSVTTTDAGSNASNSVTVTVTPSIIESSSSGQAGTSITLTGTGYAASSIVTFIFKGSSTSATATSNAVGDFSNLTFTTAGTEIPATNSVNARDASSNQATALSHQIVAATSPVLSISVNRGNVATTLSITGTSFSATATSATIRWDGAATTTTCPLSTGTMAACNYTIPSAAAGTHTISAIDNAAVPMTSATQNFFVTPTLSASSLVAANGTAITLSGSGFAANSTITIIWENADTATTVTSSSNGSFSSLIFTILSSGTRLLGAYDTARNFAPRLVNNGGGTLGVTTPSSTSLSSRSVSSSSQTSTGSLGVITVTDSRGTNAGWTCTATVTDFTSGTSGTNPVTNLTINPTNGTFGVVSGSPTGVSTGVSHKFASIADSATIMTATSGNGTGGYSVNADLSLVIPVGIFSGTYTATLVETVQ